MARTSHDPDGKSLQRRRELANRLLLILLATLLLAISCWCLALLLRSVALRQDLDARKAWVEDVRRLHLVLERPVDELVVRSRWPQVEGLRRASEQWMTYGAAGMDDPDLRDAARRLHSSLEHLHDSLAARSAAGEETSSEWVWDASFAVLKAASALEEKIQLDVDATYGRLDQHWRSLNWLLIVCLLLCASNLALLRLAYRRRGQLESSRDRALELSSHDPLTGVWNRETILKMLRRELARSIRQRGPLGLILADIDDFQQVNGLIGQEQGDVVLQEVSWRLGSLVRPYDTLGRFGGDSFLILLPTCDEGSTAVVAERLRESVNDREVAYSLGRLSVELSLVVTAIERVDDADADLIIHRLQEALIEMRRAGRSGCVGTMAAEDFSLRT